MPLDPNIALSYQPPKLNIDVPSPLAQLGQVMSLRGMMEQSQQRQMQMQQEQMNLDNLRRQTAAEQEYRTRAAAGEQMTPLQTLGLFGPTAGAKILEGQAKLQEQQFKTAGERAGRLGSLIGASTDTPSFNTNVMQAVSEGVLTPDRARALIGQGYDEDTVTQYREQGMKASDQAKAIVAAAKEKREQGVSEATIQAQNALVTQRNLETAQKQRQADAMTLYAAAQQGPQQFAAALAALPLDRQAPYIGVKSPMEIYQRSLTPEQTVTATQQAANAAETARYHGVEEGINRSRLGLEAAAQRLRQQQYDATYGAMIDPNTGKPLEPEAAKAVAAQDPVAVAIANYQAMPPSLARGGQAASIMRKVMAINPDYNAQNWQAQAGMMKSFTSGPVAKELRATNTALGHVGLMNDAIDALNNGNLRILNQFANRLGLETGSTPAAVFRTIVGKVGPELSQAYGEATGGERGAERLNFDPALPPQTLRANAAITARLLAGKINSTKFQWESTMGKRALPMVSPEAQSVLDRLAPGASPGQGHAAAPTAAPPGSTAATQTAAPAYQVGQSVMYQGAPHRIKEIKPNGKLVLEQ